MMATNEQQLLHDVVELLLIHKDEAIESMQDYMNNFLDKEKLFNGPFRIAFDEEFKKVVIQELRSFAIHKLNLTTEDAMAFIDTELIDIYPELDFYFDKGTYRGID